MARADISEFESYMPSHAVGLFEREISRTDYRPWRPFRMEYGTLP